MANGQAPAKAAGALIERLVAAAWSGNEFEIAGLAREANALMKVDAANAHMVLGGVAAARSDIEETRRHFRIALQLTEDLYTTKRNYSVALAMLAEHDEALSIVGELLQASPGDPRLLEHAIDQAIESARFEQALGFFERLHRALPGRKNWLATAVRDVLAAISRGLFTERGIRELLRGAADIQRREGVLSAERALSSQDEGQSFFFVRGLRAAPRRTAALNEQLADFAVGRADLMEDPGMKFVVAFGIAKQDARSS